MAQQMPNVIELYEASAQGFRRTLAGVRPNQMSNPTPCTLWNVQALINHNIKVAGFVEGVLTGNVTVNPMDVAGPLPPEGSVAALDAGVDRVLELIKARGALEKVLNTPFGAMPTAHFMMNPFTDLLVHKWDLAKATGQSTTLDRGLVEVCYNAISPHMDAMRSAEFGGQHIFGPAVTVPAGASLQDRLIGITGRHP